jgi:hypothetical protein
MSKRKITTRVILDGHVDHTFTQIRHVYTDAVGEYVKCDRNNYHIENDSFDINYYSGKAISAKELFKDLV